MIKLRVKTEQLKNHLDFLLDKYESNDPPKSMNDKPFFLEMKEKTAPIYDLLESWEDLALKMVKERKVSLHPHQVISTKENIELLLLHSFYIDAKHRRYMELNQSSHYILNQLLTDIQDKGASQGE